jgi:predicted HicB family RNase H-like nuclease
MTTGNRYNKEKTVRQENDMKNKVTFEVRIDEELYKKLLVASAEEGRSLNNQMLHLIRTNIAYFERCHGKIDPSKAVIPEKEA